MSRTIFLTPGLVELGPNSRQIHHQIAQKLIDAKIDLVILIETSSSRFIAEYINTFWQNSNSQKNPVQSLESENQITENEENSEIQKANLGNNSENSAENSAENSSNKKEEKIDEKLKLPIQNSTKIPQITIFKSAKIAHQNLQNILQKGDVILFQNDWTDNYS